MWIVDAYTTTDSYPYSQHINLNDATADTATAKTMQFATQNNVNYMRNSVKAVVDAYDGSVQLYQWDKEDPILKSLAENLSWTGKTTFGNQWRFNEPPALPGRLFQGATLPIG